MSTYRAIHRPAKAWSTDDGELMIDRPSIQVWEVDKTPSETGIVDVHGTMIYRVPEATEIGFRGRSK